jgi:hypothetical protein
MRLISDFENGKAGTIWTVEADWRTESYHATREGAVEKACALAIVWRDQHPDWSQGSIPAVVTSKGQTSLKHPDGSLEILQWRVVEQTVEP